MTRTCLTLHENWSFTRVGGNGGGTIQEGEWLSVHSFPTTVHVELIKLKKIPDPVEPLSLNAILVYTNKFYFLQFIGLNEWDVQCMYHFRILGKKFWNWIYLQGSAKRSGHSKRFSTSRKIHLLPRMSISCSTAWILLLR